MTLWLPADCNLSTYVVCQQHIFKRLPLRFVLLAQILQISGKALSLTVLPVFMLLNLL